MPTDGITRLIAVTQLKSANANDEAQRAADKQRDLINQQKSLRGTQRTFEELSRGDQQSALLELRSRLPAFRQSLSPAAAALLDLWVQWAGEHR